MGSAYSPRNVSNYIRGTGKRIYGNFYTEDSNDVKINLEKKDNQINRSFDNIFLLNVLEHIKNYNNCIFNIRSLLNKNGYLYGSTPFLFHIHPSPNDYLRYTEQFLEEMFIENGFAEIKIKPIGTGIFCCIYSLIFELTKKIPLINVLLFPIAIILDKIISLFKKNYQATFPIGYFFVAKKNK